MGVMSRTGALLLAAVLGAACQVNLATEGVVSRETRTFNVTARPDVVLDTFDGAIEVHSWDRPDVEVEIDKRAMEQMLVDQMTVEAEQQGNRIVVRVKGPSTGRTTVTVGVHISPSAALRVALPRGSNLEARSGDGSIRVEDVEGRIQLDTADGSVSATRVAGDVRIRTGDGTIRLDRASGHLDVETSDGSIAGEATPTVLRAKTGDGSVRLRIEPDSVMADTWDVSTSDGSVVLTLPASFDAAIDAETSDGTVRASHPRLAEGSERTSAAGEDRRESRRTLRATMGEGGKTLRVRSGGGSIRIES
jgi:DUF4097 and DUF4098 domain-containing protein YvlB